MENSCACLSVELTLLTADTDGEKKNHDQYFRLKFCVGTKTNSDNFSTRLDLGSFF